MENNKTSIKLFNRAFNRKGCKRDFVIKLMLNFVHDKRRWKQISEIWRMQSKYLPVMKAFVYRLFCLEYFAHKLIHLFLSSIMMMLLKITFSWSTRQTPSRLWRKFMSFIKIFLFIHIIRWCVCHHACANKMTKKRRLWRTRDEKIYV